MNGGSMIHESSFILNLVELDEEFRHATSPFDTQAASKWVGDCYLLAYAKQTASILVTFDRALLNFARKEGYRAISPA